MKPTNIPSSIPGVAGTPVRGARAAKRAIAPALKHAAPAMTTAAGRTAPTMLAMARFRAILKRIDSNIERANQANERAAKILG